MVNAKLSLNGRVGVSHDSSDTSRSVMANVVSEASSFSVRAPGMGHTALSLGMGANYNITNAWTVGASYRMSVAKDAQTSNSFYLNTALAF